MSYNATGNSAGRRIATLLDEGSFVEIGGAVTARSTDFNLQEKETPADGVITGYGVIDGNLVYVYSHCLLYTSWIISWHFMKSIP